MPKIQTDELTVEQLTWLRVFLAAYQKGEVWIPAPAKGLAVQRRHALYRAGRKLLNSTELRARYPELVEARLNCSAMVVTLTMPLRGQSGECFFAVHVYRSNMSPMMQDVCIALGAQATDIELRPATAKTPQQAALIAGVAESDPVDHKHSENRFLNALAKEGVCISQDSDDPVDPYRLED